VLSGHDLRRPATEELIAARSRCHQPAITDRRSIAFMAETAKDAIAALRRSHDELVTIIEGLDPEALTTASGSSEWTVADVLSHLGSAAEIGLNTLTAGKADFDSAPAIWDRWNAMSPGEKASSFVTASERLVEALEALDDDDLANKTVDVGFLPAPIDIAFLVGMRLGEVGLHRWDVAVAFDAGATVPDYIVPFVLGQLPMFAGFFAQPAGQTGRIAVETVDPRRNYVLEMRDDGATLIVGHADDAETRLALSSEAFVRLTAGRLDADHTPASVTVEGVLSLDDLRGIFPGY
jgi:uncharacterized protein (TIGR03083 family)